MQKGNNRNRGRDGGFTSGKEATLKKLLQPPRVIKKKKKKTSKQMI